MDAATLLEIAGCSLIAVLLGLACGLEIAKVRKRRRERLRAFEDPRRETFWQRIFSQSPLNGEPYRGGDLPERKWNWPKETFLQRSLKPRDQNRTKK